MTRDSNIANVMAVCAAVFNDFLPDGDKEWLCQKPCSHPFDNGCSNEEE